VTALFAPLVASAQHDVAADDGATDDGAADGGVADDGAGGERKWFLDGHASEEYRFRHVTSAEVGRITSSGEIISGQNVPAENDHDLRFFLGGYLWESGDNFAADLAAAAWVDLDGTAGEGQPSAVAEVDDYEAPHAWQDAFDVYSLYAEYHSAGWLALARGGRQTSEHGRPITFDGATLTFRAIDPHLDLVLFGGRTVHFFDLGQGLFEDWVASAVAVVRPVPPLRLELDYRLASETSIAENRITDHSYGLTAWLTATHWARAKGYVRGLDDALSNAGGGVLLEWSEAELGFEAGADAQLVTLREINERDDPYFAVLGESLPHVLVKADLWKDLTTELGVYSLHAGWNGRLLTAGEPTMFNRDYGRIYLWFQATDIAIDGPFANLVGEYNYTHRETGLGDDSLFAIGGSLGWDWKIVRAEAGSYYHRYKYTYFLDAEELAHVRTYFGELEYEPLEWLSIRVRYEYDQLDRDIHTLMLKLTQVY